MSDGRRALGAMGEAIASERLTARGWPIIATNWRCRYGEIDLVARDGDSLVIIEVRARATKRYGQPEESVGGEKRRRLIRLGERYIQHVGWPGAWRIDVIAIAFAADGAVSRYTHIENAVSPT